MRSCDNCLNPESPTSKGPLKLKRGRVSVGFKGANLELCTDCRAALLNKDWSTLAQRKTNPRS